MRAVQVMDIPMLKDFINALVMDSLTYGKILICAYVHVLPLSPFLGNAQRQAKASFLMLQEAHQCLCGDVL